MYMYNIETVYMYVILHEDEFARSQTFHPLKRRVGCWVFFVVQRKKFVVVTQVCFEHYFKFLLNANMTES